MKRAQIIATNKNNTQAHINGKTKSHSKVLSELCCVSVYVVEFNSGDLIRREWKSFFATFDKAKAHTEIYITSYVYKVNVAPTNGIRFEDLSRY